MIRVLYQNWGKNLDIWKHKLRHLKWVSEYRMNILKSIFDLKGKEILDIGSGPQFLSDLLKQEGSKVTTLDKFAPADICIDINDKFESLLGEKKFDIVVLGAVIRYIKDIKCFLSKISYFIKDNGYIFMDEFVHNMFNDAFLNFMVSVGAMENWPKESFVSLEKIENIISKIKEYRIEKIYSCWPLFYLEGKWIEPVWYTVIIKKVGEIKRRKKNKNI